MHHPSQPPTPATQPVTSMPSTERRSYTAPKLVHLGSVRDLTLGKSTGRRGDVGTKIRP